MSDSNRLYDTERTLPPIRDLFYDLCTPHDSPSMTLARLRVTNKCDGPIRTNSSLGIYRPQDEVYRRPCTPQSELPKIHLNPQQSLKPPFISHSPKRSFEAHPAHVLRPYERYRRTRHSLPFTPDSVTGYAPQELIMHRHLSFSSPTSYDYALAAIHSEKERLPVLRYDFDASDFSGQSQMFRHPVWPGEICTVGHSMRIMKDERTPIARDDGIAHQGRLVTSGAQEEPRGGPSSSKYECGYCGKGFNRPSSLKIHLNSHTGAKPFVCPVNSCGRSFSVLSNMRRHARLHTQTPLHTDPSSDEDSEQSFAITGSVPPSATLDSHSRSDSTASVSSVGSRRGHASGDDTAQDDAHPEKRFRINAH